MLYVVIAEALLLWLAWTFFALEKSPAIRHLWRLVAFLRLLTSFLALRVAQRSPFFARYRVKPTLRNVLTLPTGPVGDDRLASVD